MKNIRLLICVTILWTACGNPETSSETYADTSQDGERTSECFMAKDYQYEDLLTKDDIAKHVSIDEPSYKMNISPTKGKYGSCDYQWNSTRPVIEKKLLGQIMNVPDRNRVSIKMLDFYTDRDQKLYNQESARDLFDQSYKKLSQAEYEVLLANLRNANADKPEVFETAKGFLDARMNFKYEPLDNLGDRAYWKWHDEHGIALVVLTGMTTFTIESKTTADPATSLDHAVKFAKAVLAKCES